MTVYLYCHFGSVITESFSKCGDLVYESHWLELPINLQRFSIMMIQNSHLELAFKGFDMVELNLESFTNVRIHFIQFHNIILMMSLFQVTKTVVSFYLAFKTLTAD